MQDLQTVVSALQERPARCVVAIDEFSAIAAEHVAGLFARARSAGISLLLGTQELSDLRLPGREMLQEQVLGNLTSLIAHRQVVPASAELIARLAGSRGAWRTSVSSDGRTYSHAGQRAPDRSRRGDEPPDGSGGGDPAQQPAQCRDRVDALARSRPLNTTTKEDHDDL